MFASFKLGIGCILGLRLTEVRNISACITCLHDQNKSGFFGATFVFDHVNRPILCWSICFTINYKFFQN